MTNSRNKIRQVNREELIANIALEGDAWPRDFARGRRKLYTLSLERLRPSIRIAHRSKGLLNIPERIILDHELVLILSGTGDLRFDSASIPFKPNDLFFIPPFGRHAFASCGVEVEHIAIHFDLAAQVPSCALDLRRCAPYEVRLAHGARVPRRTVVGPGDSIRSWLRGIVTSFALGAPLPRLQADVLLLNVLTGLIQARPNAEGPANDLTRRIRIDRALRFLEKNLSRHLVPSDLAEAAGMSTSHFNRLFRRWTGLPPGEYILRRRVEEARKLLGNVDLSIKEIAALCGFDDPYHFSRAFRRIDGLPPTHFRQALLAGRP